MPQTLEASGPSVFSKDTMAETLQLLADLPYPRSHRSTHLGSEEYGVNVFDIGGSPSC